MSVRFFAAWSLVQDWSRAMGGNAHGIDELEHAGHSSAALLTELFLIEAVDRASQRDGATLGLDFNVPQSRHLPASQKVHHAAFQLAIRGVHTLDHSIHSVVLLELSGAYA